MAQTTQALRWLITGRVQGVWFRDSTRRAATPLGIRGWVKNLPDGSVEAHVLGDASDLDRLRTTLSEGPGMARVDQIAEEALDPAAADADFHPSEFEIRY